MLVGLLVMGCSAKESPGEQAASDVEDARKALASVTPSVASAEPSERVSAPPQPAVLTKNPLYRAGRLPAARCKAPRYAVTSVATARTFYTELLRCMNKAWQPVIRKAGFTFQPPKLVVTNGQSPSSPCEFADGQAYYCHGTISMDAAPDLAGMELQPVSTKIWMAFNFGHEYGHHVQVLTGMLEANYERGLTLNGVEVALEESRRVELQASCLSGVFLGADRASIPVTADWRERYQSIVGTGNDPERDHGSPKNHERWSLAGLDAADPAACNTYVAASAQVS
ncbi:protein of unknown function zinc metallopeptidase putative [Kribbella flavida DSM 17836]|uniref:Metalloprotease-like protein n=1 Tax=Kribbella flavida (strain DSM 17836 / JCM 10339 / NBRC 14399) TaxID=479435 RepID=D2Q467_KRIFD|nr:protein of unknown function zinc metallopeptidase putative [Kribbella flavida DSM 17836]